MAIFMVFLSFQGLLALFHAGSAYARVRQ